MRRYNPPYRRPFAGPPGWLLGLVALAALALVALLLKPVEPPFSGIAYVVDGDTLRIATERVRLLGIDAPELAQTCTGADGLPWQCGEAARTLLAQSIAGSSVRCAPSGRDRYGRILAKCSAGETDLGGVIVGAGLAVAEFEYVPAELAARAAGKGIWAGPFDNPKDWRDAHGEGAASVPFVRLRTLTHATILR